MPLHNNTPVAHQSTIVNIPTSNRYSTLEHAPVNENDNTQSASSSNDKTSNKRIHCPPITVIRQDARQIRNLLRQNNIPDDVYHTKGIKGGLLVITNILDVHKKIAETMSANSLEFFTHQINSEIPIKIVLSGLPPMDTAELKVELESVDVKPIEIKAIPTKSVDLVPYLLHFAKGTVRLQDLRKIRYVCNTVVGWKKYRKKPGMAVQCHRCQRYGHGSKYCNLTPVCVKCGQAHLTGNCKLPTKKDGPNERNTREQIMCANCGGNHTANYKGCKSRKTYLQLRQQTNKRRAGNKQPSTSSQNVIRRQDGINSAVPTISQASVNTPLVEERGDRHFSRPLYSQVLREGVGAKNQHNQPAMHTDLFTISEFMGLARDLYFRLRRCTSKEDQFFALSELMIQYVYDGK